VGFEADLVAASIDDLYDVFVSYPRPVTITGCGCGVCFDGRPLPGETWGGTARPLVVIDAPGGGLPVREVDAAALEPIVANVPGTGGTVAILKHYLPRICELLVMRDSNDLIQAGWPDTEWLGSLSDTSELHGVPWWEWPRRERVALQEFFDAWWLRDRRAGLNAAEATLCSLGEVVLDLGRYLDAWSRDPSTDAIASREQLREEFVRDGTAPLTAPTKIKLEPLRSNRRRLRRWLAA
jgi:hypothetical protein